MKYIRLLIAFVIPPIAIFMQFGWSWHLVINTVLTLLGFVPGVVHAVYIMAARPPGLIRRDRFNRPYPSRGRAVARA